MMESDKGSEIQLTPLDLAPLDELRQQICDLESIDLLATDLDEIRERVRTIMMGHLSVPHAVRMPRVFRARIGGRDFSSASELWYPPSSVVTRLGRANNAGEPAFYCSDERDVAILEVTPSVGDLVTVLEAVPRKPEERFLLSEIGITRHAKRHGTLIREKGLLHGSVALREALSRSGRKERVEIIDDLLVRHFTKLVRRDADHEYKISLAIAQIHRLPLANATPQLDGLWYPSVAVGYTGTNVALTPSAADELLKPELCTVFHVVDRVGTGFVIRQVRGPAPMAEDGRILW